MLGHLIEGVGAKGLNGADKQLKKLQRSFYKRGSISCSDYQSNFVPVLDIFVMPSQRNWCFSTQSIYE